MANERSDVTVSLLGEEVRLTGKVMLNGEMRRRVRFEQAAIHLATTKIGGWQESHFHKGVRETYVVVEGQMALATQDPHGDGSPACIRLYKQGDCVTTEIEEAHNVYLFAGAVIATIVYGASIGNPSKKGNDWWPADEGFDGWTKSLKEADIHRLTS